MVASSAEAELGTLFLNAKEGKIRHNALHEVGHKQPSTSMHCDNVTTTCIVNDTIKKQQSRSTEMRFVFLYHRSSHLRRV